MESRHHLYTDIIVKYFKKNFDWVNFEICSDSKNDNFPGVGSIKIKNDLTNELLLKVPDFSATNHYSYPRISILGEAKTYKDFLDASNRRDGQIDYMLQFLKIKEKPFLIYSLPFQLHASINNLLIEKKVEHSAQNVEVIILNELSVDF